jgi:hypothetical protein
MAKPFQWKRSAPSPPPRETGARSTSKPISPSREASARRGEREARRRVDQGGMRGELAAAQVEDAPGQVAHVEAIHDELREPERGRVVDQVLGLDVQPAALAHLALQPLGEGLDVLALGAVAGQTLEPAPRLGQALLPHLVLHDDVLERQVLQVLEVGQLLARLLVDLGGLRRGPLPRVLARGAALRLADDDPRDVHAPAQEVGLVDVRFQALGAEEVALERVGVGQREPGHGEAAVAEVELDGADVDGRAVDLLQPDAQAVARDGARERLLREVDADQRDEDQRRAPDAHRVADALRELLLPGLLPRPAE